MMNKGKLRQGYTTGTCAQAATKAAMQILLGLKSKEDMHEVVVELPKGERLNLKIVDIRTEQEEEKPLPVCVSCAVKKDSGDDPDITNGVLVYSKVTRVSGSGQGRCIRLDGGTGIGRVTKPGLEQAVGEAAINRVPRQMILKEVEEACEEVGYEQGICVEISIPEGEKLAKKTFNPRLGVEGGLSILGTSGIVEPMSEQALLDTIYLDMKVKMADKKCSRKYLIVTPGNYGLEFLKEEYQVEESETVKCSNFIGQAIDMAVELGCEGFLLAGHIGKLVKVAGGIMNTHSKWADGRMEILASAALRAGICGERAKSILDCVTTDDALAQCTKQERTLIMEQIMKKMEQYLIFRAGDGMQIGAVTFSKVYGILGKTSLADEIMEAFKADSKK